MDVLSTLLPSLHLVRLCARLHPLLSKLQALQLGEQQRRMKGQQNQLKVNQD